MKNFCLVHDTSLSAADIPLHETYFCVNFDGALQKRRELYSCKWNIVGTNNDLNRKS